jgi:putative aldouronate transport system substrate-binding protein
MKEALTGATRIVSLLLALLMIVSLAAGCAPTSPPAATAGQSPEGGQAATAAPSASAESGATEEPSNFNAQGMPIVNEKLTLRFAVPTVAAHKNGYKEMGFFDAVEEATNVHIEFMEIEGAVWAEKIKLIFSASDIPDAVYGHSTASSFIYALASQKAIVPLRDLIDQYSVNLKTFYESRPDIYANIIYPDGNIYALPGVNEPVFQSMNSYLQVNQDWLDALGLPVPQTLDEFYETLRAFKAYDANGNGVADEIPMTFTFGSGGGSLTGMFAWFGAISNSDNVMLKDGKVVFSPQTQEYRQALEFLAKLYAEQLIDHEGLTQDRAQAQAKVKAGAGFMFENNPLIGLPGVENNFTIVPVIQATETPPLIDFLMNAILQENRFYISSTCQHPEVALRWIDYIMDDNEISLTSRFGKLGISYIENPDGTWTIDESAQTDNPRDEYCAYSPVNATPWISSKATYGRFVLAPNDALKVEWHELYKPYQTSEIMPRLKYMEEETREFNAISADLGKYTNEAVANFIMNGVTDQSWDQYLRDLDMYKVTRYIEIMQTAYDRTGN